jgi:DNA-binding NarL/FixJ family response regulator
MEERAPTRVLLADHPGFGRTALAMLLRNTPGVILVTNVAEPDQIRPAVEEFLPDVVVVDDRLMRDEPWIAQDLGTRVIVVGVDDDPGFAERARHIGAEAWVRKDQADAVLPVLLT